MASPQTVIPSAEARVRLSSYLKLEILDELVASEEVREALARGIGNGSS
jgi:hypothetical protein